MHDTNDTSTRLGPFKGFSKVQPSLHGQLLKHKYESVIYIVSSPTMKLLVYKTTVIHTLEPQEIPPPPNDSHLTVAG